MTKSIFTIKNVGFSARFAIAHGFLSSRGACAKADTTVLSLSENVKNVNCFSWPLPCKVLLIDNVVVFGLNSSWINLLGQEN